MAEKDKSPEDDALNALRRQVDAARGQNVKPSPDEPPSSAANLAMRMGGEFVAAILVGAAIGIGIDYLAHISPWGVTGGVAVGFVAGVVNVVRAAGAYARANPVDPNAPSVPDDDED
ncbi:MAG TPA: AtpZ/AtpI family protein [Caulobacterales bacterium]|jgi:F0F1-type ATP synthase assembly protein I|nr:AtpZ/AtpI family protein [Caulobacterales bacterium]